MVSDRPAQKSGHNPFYISAFINPLTDFHQGKKKNVHNTAGSVGTDLHTEDNWEENYQASYQTIDT